jgi:hypothetical protein
MVALKAVASQSAHWAQNAAARSAPLVDLAPVDCLAAPRADGCSVAAAPAVVMIRAGCFVVDSALADSAPVEC